MKQQVIITKSVCGWFNVKNTDHELLLNIAPDVFKKHFPEVSEDICVACLELDISRMLELKNKKKVGS
ncbi:pathogenicity island protein [Staphylococcus nepalensis]|uniref:Pathogenicity island protein n=1 Tax=Staphylococcus nepalensis TaxID=214473 RepID=A0A2T4S6W9_9STAP|nr:pathogenicity island protein [Staphylococcus nepalensis]PTK53912.1 pathogenicity island protein [Staphylococcus nepalensis]